MKIRTVLAKNLLTRSRLPDADFVINPYIGCNHGCIYCYAEFMSRFTGHAGEEWGSFIDVKAGGGLRGRLDGKSILIGSVTDPYNMFEKKYENTRTILKRLQDEAPNTRVEILTKSPLVLRDIDIISRMQNVKVGISLSSLDESFTHLTEKYAATPRQRLDAIQRLYEAGIPVYVFISPIFPYFSDYLSVVSAVERYAEKICFENLNLRGRHKKMSLDLIKENFPERYDDFAVIYSSKKYFNAYWHEEEEKIQKAMSGKQYKIYFFHDEIKKGAKRSGVSGL